MFSRDIIGEFTSTFPQNRHKLCTRDVHEGTERLLKVLTIRCCVHMLFGIIFDENNSINMTRCHRKPVQVCGDLQERENE